MAKDITEIINAASVVRDETDEAANTAARVGGSIAEIAQYIKDEIITPLLAAQSQAVSAERIAEYAKKIAEEAAQKISTAFADKEYYRQNIYLLQEGIGCAAFDYAMSLGDVTIQSEEVTRQEGDSIILDTSANRFVLERSGKFYTKFLSNGASMQGSDVYANSRHTFLNRQDTSYWYRMADGTLAKGSSTFAIRNWLDTLQDDFDWAETEIVQHGSRITGLETKIQELGAFATYAALFAKAAKFDIVSNNAIALLHGTYRQAEGIYHGVLILQQVEKNNAGGGTAMQYIYIDKQQYTRYINFSATSVTEVQSVQNHGARNITLSGRVLQLKNMWGYNVGGGATLPDNSNLYEGTAGASSVPVVLAKTFGGTMTATLGAATSARAGVMTAADKSKLDNMVLEIPWTGYHMNMFTERGEYQLYGERTDANDGLPILNAASGHTIDARLTVLDSSLTRGTGEKTDTVVTQILRLSNRMGGDGHVYVRTAQAATKSQLATPSSTAWGTWEKLMGIFEKNAVTNIADLDTYTTNGMYSGLFQFEGMSEISGGVEMFTGSTFLMITVNGYAVAKAGLTPQLTQMLYLLPAKDFNATAKMYLRTAYWNASAKSWNYQNWDKIATANDLSPITVEVQTAKTLANSARETATAASTAAQEAKTAADNANNLATEAKTTAAAAQTKNTEQDARLEKIENSVSHLSAAGRYWNEANGTPTAAGHYGSLDALRSLPEKLGLGRYLVKDDRTRRKLDPTDSTKYADDGTDAALDGSQGQCMWCWNGFYANVWKEGDKLFKVVSFVRPVGNDISIWIPAGGISWLGAGVMDRTEMKLCSVISDDERYRGGGGTALDASKYSNAPAAESPQITMLGMPATNISTTNFGNYARKRGEGWEANWFVARFVVEFLFEVIMGTENSQEAFNANKDADGLYQGGFGTGVTDMPDWDNYNGTYPVIPTSVGLEAGDGVCIVPYNLPQTNGVDGGTYKTFNVPVFFGLVGAGYGNLWQWTRGLIMDAGEKQSLVYVSPSMYATYDPNTVSDKIMVAECPRVLGWITRKSYKGLCCMPTAIGGSPTLRYSDYFYTNAETSKGLRVRAAGGLAISGTAAGASYTNAVSTAAAAFAYYSAPLCYFAEDPKIPLSQSIANNN